MAAIDVVTRDSTSSAKGFPFGFLGVSKNGEFPLRVGGHKIKLSDDGNISGAKKLATLRTQIRKQTAAQMKAFGIVESEPGVFGPKACRPGHHRPHRKSRHHRLRDGRHLIRSSAGHAADLPGLGTVHTQRPRKLRQRIRNPWIIGSSCRSDELDPQKKAVQRTQKTELKWPASDNDCAARLRITDVIAPPVSANGDGPRFVVLVVLATSWGPHAENARYFAGFVRLP